MTVNCLSGHVFIVLCFLYAVVLVSGYFYLLRFTQSFYNKPHFVFLELRNETIKSISNQNYTQGINLVESAYSHGISKSLQTFPIQMQPNLEQLINWTNPKYPKNVRYLLENKDLCSSVNNLTVLVVVNSATDHFERRQAIRQTWTNDSYYSHFGTVRVLFLLGRSLQPQVIAGIETEFKEYKDILQGDFIDTYLSLTHKGVMGFKWLTERCRNAKIILKTDDDFLVNMFIYFLKLEEQLLCTNVYCDYKAGPIYRGGKWNVSKNHFRGEKFFKPFCKGKFVSMTNDIIPSLYQSAIKTPFFPYDDVLLFGYVMHNVKGLKYKTLDAQDMESKNSLAMKCLKEKKNKCKQFVISTKGKQEMENTWFMVLKNFSQDRKFK